MMTGITCVYSYLWDVTMDWKLCECKKELKSTGKYFLRSILSYKFKSFYYFAIFSNLLLRCIWILTLSTDIREKMKSAALYTLICGFLEMVRRCIWNFLRVEMEHQKNQKEFRVVEELKLPHTVRH